MKILKHIFSTIILASIAFIIPGSQMFGEEAQKEEVTDVVVFITVNSKAPKDELAILEKTMADFTAGHTDATGTPQFGELVEGSTSTQKVFRVGTYSPDTQYWVDQENGQIFPFKFSTAGIGQGKSFNWNNFKILFSIEKGPNKSVKTGHPVIFVNFVLNGVVDMAKTKEPGPKTNL